MTSPLDGPLKRAIAKGFQGKLTLGVLRRETSSGLDSKGDPTTPTKQDISFNGIREDFSLFTKANAGIPETDVKILILLGSMSANLTPKKDDLIYLKSPWNQWYKCRRLLTIDPAGASCSLQAYAVSGIAAP
jgi:hypothetical protein